MHRLKPPIYIYIYIYHRNSMKCDEHVSSSGQEEKGQALLFVSKGRQYVMAWPESSINATHKSLSCADVGNENLWPSQWRPATSPQQQFVILTVTNKYVANIYAKNLSV